MYLAQQLILSCVLLVFSCCGAQTNPDHSTQCVSDNEFDFIVVGAGSAGAVVANRLTEVEGYRVLLVEAGIEPIAESYVPLTTYKTLEGSMDWNYKIESQKHACHVYKHNRTPFNRGKCLGGSSSLNFMTYTRGNKRDYDHWEKLGNEGWGYKKILKYFLKYEDYRVTDKSSPKDEAYHSTGGPVSIETPPFKTQFSDYFLEAAAANGIPHRDYNGEHQIGAMLPPVFTRNGSRWNSWIGYIQPILKRPNFVLLAATRATKVLFDSDKRATGIVYDRDVPGGAKNCIAKATKEVILSAGVIASPQLLMLSGVGPKKTLEKFKIPVVHNLPGVGQNFHDHIVYVGDFYASFFKKPFNSYLYENFIYKWIWDKTKTGPMTVPLSFEGVAYLASKFSEDPEWPDFEIFFNSDNGLKLVKQDLKLIFQPVVPQLFFPIVTPIVIFLHPRSRGYIDLRSADPYDDPIIDPKYLSDENDVKIMVEGIKRMHKIMRTKPFSPFNALRYFGGLFPQCVFQFFNEDKNTECKLKYTTSTGYHPGGSCKMAPKNDSMGVVDNKLRVYGVKGLRVIDASIMPRMVSSHPAAAVTMIAEKASDDIKEEYK